MESRQASVYFVDADPSRYEAVVALAASADAPCDAPTLLDGTGRAFASTPPSLPRSRSIEQLVPGIVGTSAPLRRALEHVRAVAATETTVLIQGETGTGKERVARALHALSSRTAGPFITVNCAAIPANLLESELIGHERGAFTGALGQRIGRFELAQNGTIFLDELGELPLELQPKLLRVLQEREFERLGGTRTLRTNARVIAATNRDLREMIGQRTFREDLYYRLSVFPIVVPPLRERKADLELLAEHFVQDLAARMGKTAGVLTAASLANLCAYDWPGNIRELQNVLERAVIFSDGRTLDVPPLAPESVRRVPGSVPERSASAGLGDGNVEPDSLAFDDVSKAHILRVLRETNWVIAGPHGAAARLRMKRTTLNFRMKKLGIVRHAQS